MGETPLDLELWVDQMALLVSLPLQPEHRAGVVANFDRIQAIAQLVMELPLPDEVETAPVFEP
jgi:hypothetical protein